MQNRTTILFPLILMGFMALITFWINKAVEQQGPRIDGSERHDPDYTMENFVTKQTDEDGNLNKNSLNNNFVQLRSGSK